MMIDDGQYIFDRNGNMIGHMISDQYYIIVYGLYHCFIFDIDNMENICYHFYSMGINPDCQLCANVFYWRENEYEDNFLADGHKNEEIRRIYKSIYKEIASCILMEQS